MSNDDSLPPLHLAVIGAWTFALAAWTQSSSKFPRRERRIKRVSRAVKGERLGLWVGLGLWLGSGLG